MNTGRVQYEGFEKKQDQETVQDREVMPKSINIHIQNNV
jgi:hypothetical protein